MLTANDLETDIVAGLETGADDYITKPFSLAVLRARVNTQLLVLTARSPSTASLTFRVRTPTFSATPLCSLASSQACGIPFLSPLPAQKLCAGWPSGLPLCLDNQHSSFRS